MTESDESENILCGNFILFFSSQKKKSHTYRRVLQSIFNHTDNNMNEWDNICSSVLFLWRTP